MNEKNIKIIMWPNMRWKKRKDYSTNFFIFQTIVIISILILFISYVDSYSTQIPNELSLSINNNNNSLSSSTTLMKSEDSNLIINNNNNNNNNIIIIIDNKKPKFNRDVKNLKLTSDFRSVKLNWIYEHNDTNVPVSFDIRFCEITSWNSEIKCRHKSLLVEQNNNNNNTSVIIIKQQQQQFATNSRIELVHQLDPNGFNYETQIYDLRALTNYTFEVQVLRFANEPQQQQQQQLIVTNKNSTQEKSTATIVDNKTTNDGNSSIILFSNQHKPTSDKNNFQQQQQQRSSRGGQSLARRLNLFKDSKNDNNVNSLDDIARIETKPFAAEATKCLADVTEVVINTGKYFGGRISAEDSLDPRCSLIGNKTSEQSSYSLKIDHELCNSKILDGNRIETMVLVHENKDILTHNTARFLVLCNFKQKSFTLRASISLPKVNNQLLGRTTTTTSNLKVPAVITSLPGKPINQQQLNDSTNSLFNLTSESSINNKTTIDNNKNVDNNVNDKQTTKTVMLGSMPGIYRTKAALAAAAAALESQLSNLNNSNYFSQKNDSNNNTDEIKISNWKKMSPSNIELETNTIEKIRNEKQLLLLQKQQQQQQQEEADRRANVVTSSLPLVMQNDGLSNVHQQRQSKELNGFLQRDEHNKNLVSFTDNNNNNNNNRHNQNGQRARALALSSFSSAAPIDEFHLNSNNNNYKILLPEPVQVQSKVLYVDRTSLSSRSAKEGKKEFNSLVGGIQTKEKEKEKEMNEFSQALETTTISKAKERIQLNGDGGNVQNNEEVQKSKLSSSSFSNLMAASTSTPSIQTQALKTTEITKTEPAPTIEQQTAAATTKSMAETVDSSKFLKQLIAPEKTQKISDDNVAPSSSSSSLSEIFMRKSTRSDPTKNDYNDNFQQVPITMTNNHRIIGDFMQLSNSPLNLQSKIHDKNNSSSLNSSDNNNNNVNFDNSYSIKYSAANIDEYPLLVDQSSKELLDISQLEVLRGRNSRMRSSQEDESLTSSSSSSSYSTPSIIKSQQHKSSQLKVKQLLDLSSSGINRMGEINLDAKLANHSNDLIAETSNNNESKIFDSTHPDGNEGNFSSPTNNDNNPTQSLAQNITSYLLKWSLKTLTNIAKKSLESLVKSDNSSSGSGSSSDIDNNNLKDSSFLADSSNVNRNDNPLVTANQAFEQEQRSQLAANVNFPLATSINNDNDNNGQSSFSSSLESPLSQKKMMNSILTKTTTTTTTVPLAKTKSIISTNRVDQQQPTTIKTNNFVGANNLQQQHQQLGTINQQATSKLPTPTPTLQVKAFSKQQQQQQPALQKQTKTQITTSSASSSSLSQLNEKDELLDNVMLTGQALDQTINNQQTNLEANTAAPITTIGLSKKLPPATQKTSLPLLNNNATIEQQNLNVSHHLNSQINQQQSMKHQRFNNYSKSFDWNKQESLSSSALLSSKTTINNNDNNNNNNNNNKINGSSPRYKLQKSPTSLEQQQQQQQINQQNLNSAAHLFNDNNEQQIINKFASINSNKFEGVLYYNNWLLYGLILLVSLVTGIFLVLWLVSLYSNTMNITRHHNKNRNRRAGKLNEQTTLQPIVQFHDHQFKPQPPSSSTQVIFDDSNSNNNNNRKIVGNVTVNNNNDSLSNTRVPIVDSIHYDSSSSSTYQKFNDYTSNVSISSSSDNSNNKFNDNILAIENSLLAEKNKLLMLNNLQSNLTSSSSNNKKNQKKLMLMTTNDNDSNCCGGRPSPSSTVHSQLTRSTSDGCSSSRIMIIDENDCKNNEFFYTEHVLINTSKGFGESYA